MMRGYSVTIIDDRYCGSYSGAQWTAWPLSYDQIPEGPEEGDGDCMTFWQTYTFPVGKGATPQAALEDLDVKMKGQP